MARKHENVLNKAASVANYPGVDVDYLYAVMMVESGGREWIGATTSSAKGLFQFIDSTWANMYAKHGARLGLVNNPLHAESNAILGALYIEENLRYLKGKLPNHTITPADAYAMHFLGAGGGSQLIIAAERTPNADAVAMFPSAASANKSIFYKDGRRATVAEVYDELERRVGRYHQETRNLMQNDNKTTDTGFVDYQPVEQEADTGRALEFKDGIPRYGREKYANRVEQMQSDLLAVGFQCGHWNGNGVDGKFGRDTRKSLVAYQEKQIEAGLLPKETKLGVFDEKTKALLSKQAEEKGREKPSNDVQSTKVSSTLSEKDREALEPFLGKDAVINADDPQTLQVAMARRDLLNELRQYVGQSWGDGNNNGIKIRQLGCEGQPWCAGFASWILKEILGADANGLKTFGSQDMANRAKNMGALITDNKYVPKPGDIVIERNADGTGHVAFVERVEGNKIICIAGNLGKDDKVGRQTYKIGDKDTDYIDFGKLVLNALKKPNSQVSQRYSVEDVQEIIASNTMSNRQNNKSQTVGV